MMFYELVRREIRGSLPRLLFMASLQGLSNAAILATINAGAQSASEGESTRYAAALFVLALYVYAKTRNYVLISSTAEIEGIIHKVRLRLMDFVRRSEMVALETIGRPEIVAAITREAATLTQTSIAFVVSAQGVVLLVFVGIYLAYLSLLAFAMIAALTGIAVATDLARTRHPSMGRRVAMQWENRLFDHLSDLLDGFKEVRLNAARSHALFTDIIEVSRTAGNIKIGTEIENLKRAQGLQTLLYLLLGTIVFVVPLFSSSFNSAIAKTTTTLLFVIGACWGLVQLVPLLSAANLAAEKLEQLEQRLRATVTREELLEVQPRTSFEKIEMRQVMFSYLDKFSNAAFQVGPLDFTLQRGDLVFITGGNGSGKSTFLKLLAGLYPPDSGRVTLDGTYVSDNTREIYRNLFSAIFTDYHLFPKLYGMPNPDPGEIDRLLTQFELQDKTSVTNGEFRTLDLSGGQRKRLAMIVSFLEKRPILLLDEWTADQDPEFRRKFYDELLPQSVRSGATLVVVTHDDRYLSEIQLPSRRLRMDEGRIVSG
jgi:putative pyoverdin transport system ATP-binding/permease protein